MKKILLARGEFTLVDDGDYEWLSQWKWYKTAQGYAFGYIGKYQTILMHRLIMKASKGTEIDHINHNKLDNQRKNLRFVNRSQNNMNNKDVNIYFEKQRNLWRTRININGKSLHIGFYKTRRGAILAYRWAAKKYYGQFAYK